MRSSLSQVGDLAVARFGESADLIWRVERGDGLQDFLHEVSELAMTSVCALTPEAGPSQPMSRGAVWASRVIRRGVRSRTVLGSPTNFSVDERDYYHWLIELGAEIRWTAAAIDRLFLVDGQLALIKQDAAQQVSAPLVITNPSLVAALGTWFELTWSSARLMSDGFDGISGTRSRDLELLKLLEAGLTDEAVARRLGISTRQLGRRVAGLCGELGVAGRIGLGAAAVRAGWL